MISFTLGFILSIATTSSARCSDIPQTHRQLQWSQPATIVSLSRAWQVEVHPVLTSDENQTPVTLHSCINDGSWPLFTLERSAEMYWGADSRSLLVINEPLSGSSKLLFFSINKLTQGGEAPGSDELDRMVKQILFQRFGEKKQIEFYLPRFVSWKKSQIVLAIGGATSSGGNGPMTPYCYGVVVDSSTLRIQSTISAGELRGKFGAECRISP